MTGAVTRSIGRKIRRFVAFVGRLAGQAIRRVVAFLRRAGVRAVSKAGERLRRRGWRDVLRVVAPASVGIALLGLAVWQAMRVLPVKGAPTAPPPAVAVELPSQGVHSTSNGYVLALVLNVKDCSTPVSVFAAIVLPKEYFGFEDSEVTTTVTKALVGIGVDDPTVKMLSIVQSGWQSDRQLLGFPHWQVGFKKSLLVGGTGRAEVLRVDDWLAHPSEVDAWFTAKWLVRRGYGSCWLRLPSLTGGNVPYVAVHAANAIDSVIGPKSGATNTGGSSGGSGTYHVNLPNGSVRTYEESEPTHTDYVDGLVPASVGYVTLVSPMSMIGGESTAPSPGVGVPRWSCGTRPHQSQSDLMKEGEGSEGGLRYFNPPTIGAFSATSSFDCSGVVALSEPGSQSTHDLMLLVIGATISLGGGLILESLLGRGRRRRETAATGDTQGGDAASPQPE